MKDVEKISLSNVLPTTTNKDNPHENNNGDNKNCRGDGPSNNNADYIHTGTESVQKKGDSPQSPSDVDFIVNVEDTEQLSFHDIANFEDTLNLDGATKYRILTGHFHPDDDFKFPQQFQHGCNRTLNIDWLKNTHFLCTVKILYFVYRVHYSQKTEEVSSLKEMTLQDDKIKEKIEVHVGSQHSDCVEKAVGLKNDLKTR